MANATHPNVKASKFFMAPAREIMTISEENFTTLDLFKQDIAETVSTLVENNTELQFQHKPFTRGGVWSIEINKLQKHCASLGCRLVQTGNQANDYTWRVVPQAVVQTASSLF